ncbi:cell division protein FtsL [Aerococcus kribbianus]|uniref:Cell division protein FtsL n=1 Tax=Aerococcus kribbianus TaxID=2999064 RepID=A0A9X3FNK7_9LACT|nr:MULTISPECIES: cell division protein FtsL [unclassified Aerococcus]MCZ0717715.1 cell division protein FtsL [Aerococcus sp. YH-aer221]MCZ0726003.1 cell division protein FtsL [Aerococcus sp. YH-aer222]
MAIFILQKEKQVAYYAMPAQKAVPNPERRRNNNLSDSSLVNPVPKAGESVETTTFFTGKDAFAIFCAFAFFMLALAFLITSRNQVVESSKQLQDIEYEIEQVNVEKGNLGQEVQELSRYDRVTDIAKDRGLEMNEDAIRNVDK